MSKMYFTADGTFGSASEVDIKIFDTATWTPEMLDAIDSCSDSERQDLAEHFDNGEHRLVIKNLSAVCAVCELTTLQTN